MIHCVQNETKSERERKNIERKIERERQKESKRI